MEIEFSRHAKRQMRWRKITELEIKEVVNHPENVEDSIYGRKNVFKKIGDRLLKVTYRHEGQKIIIITAVIKGR
jgi:hypothetical protein